MKGQLVMLAEQMLLLSFGKYKMQKLCQGQWTNAML
jgi:hypothetical protein